MNYFSNTKYTVSYLIKIDFCDFSREKWVWGYGLKMLKIEKFLLCEILSGESTQLYVKAYVYAR